MSKETRQLSGRETWLRARSLDALANPELLTLKAHALLEGTLARVLAGHFGAKVEQLPSLAFVQVAELAMLTDSFLRSLRPAILRLDEARNHCAHEWSTPQLLVHMERLAASILAEPWPVEASAQTDSYRSALQKLIAMANGVAFFASLAPEQYEELVASLQASVRADIEALRANGS